MTNVRLPHTVVETPFNYFDESKKLIYSWAINGSKIKDDKEFNTSISFTTEFVKEINFCYN